MKILLLILITLSIPVFASSKKEDKAENERLCKLFTEKAATYKKTMRDDEYAMRTLLSYEKRAKIYCSK